MQPETHSNPSRGWMRWSCSADATEADRRNARRMNLWAAVWMAVFLAALWVMETWGDESLLVATGALLVTALAAVPFLRTGARFLREADELTRMIHLRAAATGFGAGALACLFEPMVLRVLELLSVAPEHLDDLREVNPLLVMVLAFSLAYRSLALRYSR